jgi:site-specific DNA recombinase
LLTVAYVRVSTDDQVEYSPDAQIKRAKDFARLHDLGPVTVMADEGWSAGTLDRPEMQRLLGLIEDDKVANVIVWRFDRLARDSGDFTRLTRLMERHCVQLHSVAEGQAELGTASGRMQLGVHGVFAQYYRDHIVENVTRAIEDGVKSGRHLNRAPTGYRMENGVLVPGDDADIVRRVFALRAEGLAYRAIEERTGIKYSTVRQILLNRVYCGYVRHHDDWYPGLHEPLVTEAEFEAAQRAHTPGQRRSRDLLSGRVRCGLCERVAGVEYNDRGQAIYRCKHRGKGCDVPGRSANGLHRAALLGLDLLGQDDELQAAIRSELSQHLERPTSNSTTGQTVASLKAKRAKLLDLYYAERISAEGFADEERRITTQLQALEEAEAEHAQRATQRSELAERFEDVAELLSSIDITTVWDEADDRERRVLIEDLVDAVYVYPDHLRVVACGAPPLKVELTEVGLRPPAGMGTFVSEGGLEPPRP